jgi:hypothetical protein
MFTLVDALWIDEAVAGSARVQNASVRVEYKSPHRSRKSIVIHMLLAFPRGKIIHMV